MMRTLAVVALATFIAACGGQVATPASPAPEDTSAEAPAPAIDQLAEDFVKLALALGVHDKNYVDSYVGPAEWADEAEAAQKPLADVKADAERLETALAALPSAGVDPGRLRILQKMLRAAQVRIAMGLGETFSFDEETRLIYDAVAPQYDLAEFDAALAEVDALLPGEGPLNERVDAFRNALAIPAEKRVAVFDAAIAECRRRTLARMKLPENERFDLEFVTDKPWSGYNWYKGDNVSLIQINTDLPIVIDRAVDLGCHEGYPGHHTWNVLIEQDLLIGKNWIEYAVSPLFNPMGIIGEGTGNYGIELAFPGSEKIEFERDVLFPLAGLDPADAPRLEALNALRRKLSHADNHVAREYLDGRIDKEAAIEMLMKYTLASRARAEQRVAFIETYRGYVINYNLGRDLVGAYVEAAAARGEDRWATFQSILTGQIDAAGLAAGAQ